MKRRNLLFALAASAAAPELFAQAARAPARIGLLLVQSQNSPEGQTNLRSFREGMQELAHVEGRTFVIEARYADGKADRLDALAAELVASKVSVIVAAGEAGRAGVKATRTIPIVLAGVGDPVADGYAATLARPGGNITGMVTGTVETNAKQLELLTSAIRKLTRVVVLMSNSPLHERQFRELQAIAQQANLQTLALRASSDTEIDQAMSSLEPRPGSAMIVLRGSFTNLHGKRIAALALKLRLPSIASFPLYSEAGGLMSYGDDAIDRFRRTATHVDKILKGTRPGDIPFELPTRFRLAINMRTARALGVAIPQELLVRADKVIE